MKFAFLAKGPKTYVTKVDEDFTIMVIVDGNNYDFYMKRCYDDENDSQYMYMYSVPQDQESLRDAMNNAMSAILTFSSVLAPNVCSKRAGAYPIWRSSHPGAGHACSICNGYVTPLNNFCPECGSKLLWEHVIRAEEN